jgi:hypothetical protein
LNEGKGLKPLRADSASEHKEGRLKEARGGFAILIEKCKSDRAMASIGRNVSLEPTRVGKESQARTEDVASKFFAELVRPGETA